jgi:cysteine synthase A
MRCENEEFLFLRFATQLCREGKLDCVSLSRALTTFQSSRPLARRLIQRAFRGIRLNRRTYRPAHIGFFGSSAHHRLAPIARKKAISPLHSPRPRLSLVSSCPTFPCGATFDSIGDLSKTNYVGVQGHIGRTPLLRLRYLSELTGCEILGKAEFMNPGGSIKDRAALGIIEDAERRGQLRSGATIVEGTAGNTGIGLTIVGSAKGYRTVIVIPETQSVEKITLLRTLGAEVITVPEKPYSDPGNYNRQAQRLAHEKGWFWANQFDNVANRLAHYRTTGPEIWEQTSGEVTGFVASVGTGGTLAGTSLYLKERNPKIRTVCADPYGAAMYSWFKKGDLNTKDGDSFAEGIGQTRVTENLKNIEIDDAYRIPDQLALSIVYQLLREEGIFVGLSSGINLAGALRLAREGGPNQVIVTLLCDSGVRYMSKIFNAQWLKAHDLDEHKPIPADERTVPTGGREQPV